MAPTPWKPLSGVPLWGMILALPTNIRLSWKGLPGTKRSSLLRTVLLTLAPRALNSESFYLHELQKYLCKLQKYLCKLQKYLRKLQKYMRKLQKYLRKLQKIFA
jgi:hypothetical protein